MDLFQKQRMRALRRAVYDSDRTHEEPNNMGIKARWTLDERSAWGLGILIALIALLMLCWIFIGGVGAWEDSRDVGGAEKFASADVGEGERRNLTQTGYGSAHEGEGNIKHQGSQAEETDASGRVLDGNSTNERGYKRTPQETHTASPIVVHVAGAVEHGGIVYLPPQSRIFEAIEKAGGQRSDAAVEAINLAAQLHDGDYIYIPTHTEVEAGKIPSPPAVATGKTGAQRSSTSSSMQQCVDLNSADETQLQQLPGVGPALAQRIIDYRLANGAFAAVEDLDAISGVGQKLVNKVKDFVCQ